MIHLVLELLIILTTIGSWIRMFRRGGGIKSIPIVFTIILTVTWVMAAGMLALRGFMV